MKARFNLRDLFWLVLACALPLNLHSAEKEIEYSRAFPIVAYARAGEKELKPYAEQVGKLIGAKQFMEREHNPICCVWLEFVGKPSPGKPGYVILHQGGGTVIQASDADQMKIAIKSWQAKSKRTKDGDLEFPVGLMTNHKVID